MSARLTTLPTGKLAPANLTKIGLRFKNGFGESKPQTGSRQTRALDATFGKTHKFAANMGQANRALSEAKKGIQFPNIPMIMVRPAKPMRPTEAVFRVPLNLNKLQIKDYIEEVYKTPVMRVQTSIFIGKLRINRAGFYYKRADWKKAVVRTMSPVPNLWNAATEAAEAASKKA